MGSWQSWAELATPHHSATMADARLAVEAEAVPSMTGQGERSYHKHRHQDQLLCTALPSHPPFKLCQATVVPLQD